MKARYLALAASLLAVAPPSMADGRNPGSTLIYPVHRSGLRYFTVVCVTNSNLLPETPVSVGGSTNIHYEYVNVIEDPMDPCSPLGCTIFNRVEYLTPADTLCVLTSCHNAVNSGGQEGYLVVSAEDPSLFSTPWSHNFLMGSELVVNRAGGMYSINAVPFEALTADGTATDVNGKSAR